MQAASLLLVCRQCGSDTLGSSPTPGAASRTCTVPCCRLLCCVWQPRTHTPFVTAMLVADHAAVQLYVHTVQKHWHCTACCSKPAEPGSRALACPGRPQVVGARGSTASMEQCGSGHAVVQVRVPLSCSGCQRQAHGNML
jgi:hypothetical protein